MARRDDLRGVKDGYELIPAGKYEVKVKESAIVPTRDNAGELWKLTLEVMSGEFEGRLIWFQCSMSDAARPIRKGTCTALGLNTEEKPVDLQDDVIGCRALAEVYIDTYNGTEQSKVKRLRTLNKMSASEVSNLRNIKTEDLSGEDLPF